MTNDSISFPILPLPKYWKNEGDLIPLFDDYVRTRNYQDFQRYLLNIEFIDCIGNVYRVIGKRECTNHWRNVFSFLPLVNSEKMVFQRIDTKITVDELKKALIRFIDDLDLTSNDETLAPWKSSILEARTFKEVINS